MGDLRKIGKYILLEEQEQTGVGRTWRGAELAGGKIDKYLLIEFIQEQLAADDGFLDQYLSQSLVAAKLEHPNILRKVNSIHEGGKLVAAFEFHEGFSLYKVLSRCQNDGFPLHIDHALLVTSKLLSALSYAKSKHLTHGFVHPAMVFVTHEGEIKLKGFALSTALRSFSGALPLGPEFSKYVPPGLSLTSDERDQMDIFGCGAILYEMMMGEPFQTGQVVDAGARIDQAVTASSGEPVPSKIATILHKSLNPKAGLVYTDILQMAKEMEELLYSGEYSPTTFNLAFFMHSAFRGEMEAFSERIAKEREIDFSGHSISQMPAAPAPPVPTAVPAPAAHGAESPVTPGVRSTPPPARKKSKMPMVIGGLAAAAVIAVLVFVFMPKKEQAVDRFEQRAAELQAEGAKSEKALLERQREELRLQNQMLMEQLKQQAQAQQKAQEEEDVQDPEEEQARLEFEQEQEKAKKELEAERARLREERMKIEAMRRQAEATNDEPEEPQKSQSKPADNKADGASAQSKAEQKTPVKTEGKTAVPPQTADDNVTEGEDVSADTRPVDVPKQNKPAETDSGTADMPEEKPIEKPVVRKIPPVEGQLVALNDPDLNLPTLLVPYKTHQVPSKAIKAGVVRRDRTIPFIMKILVNENGDVEDSELYRSPLREGADDYGMIDKALRTANKLKFTNPSKMGVHVKVWMYITVNFTSK